MNATIRQLPPPAKKPMQPPVKSLLRVMSDLCQSTDQLPMSGNDLGMVLFWLSDCIPDNEL